MILTHKEVKSDNIKQDNIYSLPSLTVYWCTKKNPVIRTPIGIDLCILIRIREGKKEEKKEERKKDIYK